MDSFRPSKLLKGKEVIILNPGLKCVTPSTHKTCDTVPKATKC